MFKEIAEIGVSLLFPKICETCSGVLPARSEACVCSRCRSRMDKIRGPFCTGCGRTSAGQSLRCGQCGSGIPDLDGIYATFYYEGVTRELLQAYKFKDRKQLKTVFVTAMKDFLSLHLDASDFDGVVSVPMDAPKIRRRGFNQAQVFSSAVARHTGKPDLSSSFARRISRRPQSLLNKTERAKNIAGSFFVKKPGMFAGKRMLLVDDILTTGFTASECARTLKADGASSVTLLASARGR